MAPHPRDRRQRLSITKCLHNSAPNERRNDPLGFHPDVFILTAVLTVARREIGYNLPAALPRLRMPVTMRNDMPPWCRHGVAGKRYEPGDIDRREIHAQPRPSYAVGRRWLGDHCVSSARPIVRASVPMAMDKAGPCFGRAMR